jgi:hypothetical protein
MGKLPAGTPGRVSGYGLLKRPALVLQNFGAEELVNYFAVDPEVRASLKEGERNFATEASRMIARLKSGDFAPLGQECDYCDYDDLCRFKGQGTEVDE